MKSFECSPRRSALGSLGEDGSATVRVGGFAIDPSSSDSPCAGVTFELLWGEDESPRAIQHSLSLSLAFLSWGGLRGDYGKF
jgi:hypothetical protein